MKGVLAIADELRPEAAEVVREVGIVVVCCSLCRGVKVLETFLGVKVLESCWVDRGCFYSPHMFLPANGMQLANAGVEVWLVTGDNSRTAHAIAAQANITNVSDCSMIVEPAGVLDRSANLD